MKTTLGEIFGARKLLKELAGLKKFYLETGVRPGRINFNYNQESVPENGSIKKSFVVGLTVDITI